MKKITLSDSQLMPRLMAKACKHDYVINQDQFKSRIILLEKISQLILSQLKFSDSINSLYYNKMFEISFQIHGQCLKEFNKS